MAKFQLQIPHPCSEEWGQMRPTEKGAFCSSCQKEVVDFSRMSDHQLIGYFSTFKGATCGRFRAEQLNKTLGRGNRLPSCLGRWLMAAAVGLGLPTVVWGQDKTSDKPDLVQVEPQRPEFSAFTPPTLKNKQLPLQRITLSGTVVDQLNQEPIPGVTVHLLGTDKRVYTDIDGKFILSKKDVEGVEAVQFSLYGYETRTMKLSQLQPANTVFLNEDIVTLPGEVLVVNWYSPRGLWWRIKSIFY